MYQRKLERNALIGFVLCLALFAVTVAVTPGSRSTMKWLGPLSTFLIALTWGILWRDRRRARIAAELRTPPAMPPTTVRDADVAR